jgi:hypothetical protein
MNDIMSKLPALPEVMIPIFDILNQISKTTVAMPEFLLWQHQVFNA